MNIWVFDQAQVFKNPENVHNNPLDAVREIYETNIARLIESNNKLTYNLEKQIEELKEELKSS
ncbi:MAG: hypothetical protein LUH15_08125 [Tannerellaceae bacterium]|nr:hypothetical protein [Tannerellaceae bacterium]